jgi:hypothetical protein
MAMLLAGLSGFIALGFEIAWFRVLPWLPRIALRVRSSTFHFSRRRSGRLYLSENSLRKEPAIVVRVIGVLMVLGATGVSAPSSPRRVHALPFLAPAPVFFLLRRCSVPFFRSVPAFCFRPTKDRQPVSLIYVSNIFGSVLGSLGVGFVLMQHFGLRQISFQLGFLTVLTGGVVLFLARGGSKFPPVWATLLLLAGLVAVPLSSSGFDALYEKLTFGNRKEAHTVFARTVENRNGVINITKEDAVFGGGVYDGYFRIDPSHDANLIIRALILSAVHPAPKRILMIGLSSGSWGQVFANHPQVETWTSCGNQSGYLQLIPQYPVVRSSSKT